MARPTGRPESSRRRRSRNDVREASARQVVARGHLQRRQVRQIAVGIGFLIDGKQPLGQIAHDRGQCGIARRRGCMEIQVLRRAQSDGPSGNEAQ